MATAAELCATAGQHPSTWETSSSMWRCGGGGRAEQRRVGATQHGGADLDRSLAGAIVSKHLVHLHAAQSGGSHNSRDCEGRGAAPQQARGGWL